MRHFRTAMLAGAALTAVVATAAHAADGPPIEPVRIEHAVIAHEVAADEPAASPARSGWAIYAGAAAALAALLRLVGLKRVAEAVGPAVRQAAAATANAASDAGKAIGRAVSSPFRAAMWAAGLGIFALTGVGLYDVEWIAGLAFGALSAGLLFVGYEKARKRLAPAFRRVRR